MSGIWIVANPRAGPPGAARQVEAVAEALAQRNEAVELVWRTTFTELRTAVRAAVQTHATAVFVAGGDGSLGSLGGELAGTATALGCLPIGTANVFARELGLPLPTPWNPQALVQGALAQVDGGVRRMDVGRCNGLPFLAWAGIGLDAYITQHFEYGRRFARQYGFLYNTWAAIANTRHWRGSLAHVRAAGRAIHGDFFLLSAANISRYAGGLARFTPHVLLDDGVLDLWLVPGQAFFKMAWVSLVMVLTQRTPCPPAQRLTGAEFEIYTSRPQPYHVDGEPQIPSREQWRITVEPRALQLLTPRTSAHLFSHPP